MMPDKIKILFTIPNFDTAGSGKVVHDLVKGLDRAKFEPEICCFHNRGAYFKTIEDLNVKIHIFQFAEPMRPYMKFPFRVIKIYKFFKKNQFDIIHSWHWSSDISEPIAARLAGIPYVYTKKAMGWGKTWKWRSKFSSKIIAINKDMIEQYFQKMGTKVVQIPLGVDVDFFRPLPKSYKSPEGIVLKESDFVIVSVANLVPIKGMEILLNAVKQLNDNTVKLFIIGDDTTDYGTQLKDIFKDSSIYFLGKKLDIKPYLAMADVFVISTRAKGEGLPIAPLEAMASQRTVLGSNVPGVRDILASFKNCQFPPGDVLALSSKLESLRNCPKEERMRLASSMRDHVKKNFDVINCIDNHVNLYIDLHKN